MFVVRLCGRTLYLGACVLCWYWSPCQGTKFFVECHDCTSQGDAECYGPTKQCAPGTNAFYCYTFYDIEGAEQERGCATDAKLESWIVDPVEGARECKDTINGTKICYCQNHVEACPFETATSDAGFDRRPHAEPIGQAQAALFTSPTSDPIFDEDEDDEEPDADLDTVSTPGAKKFTPKRIADNQRDGADHSRHPNIETGVAQAAYKEENNADRLSGSTVRPPAGVAAGALASSGARFAVVNQLWFWLALVTGYAAL